MPHTHLYHSLLPAVFIAVWFLDAQFLHLTTWLNQFIPFEIRLIGFIVIFALALILIQLSHKALFKDGEPLEGLITQGILGRTRNPLYFGIILFYVTFLFFSISVICIILFIPIFLVYNKMADFEAKILEEMYGNEYIEYKRKVPKWIPAIKSKYPQ